MEKAALIKSIRDWREAYLLQIQRLYPRSIEISVPDKDIALALIGIRRSGKTSLAIEASKPLGVDKVFYYNFEDPIFSAGATTQDIDLLIETAEEYSREKIELLILDEIHNVPLWEKWLRKAIDLKKYRIIVTGSSAKLIQSELSTALTGRTVTKHIWTLSLAEYCDFNDRAGRKVSKPKLCRDYLTYGGFPAVTLQEDVAQKKEVLQAYFSDILLKDVVTRNKIRDVLTLRNLATYVLTNLSSAHSSVAIERALGIDRETALLYLNYLCQAFLINPCDFYSNNLKVQHRAPTKYYLSDLGLRLVGARSANSDDGKLLENLVYLELRRQGREVYYFKERGEVDFLLTDAYRPDAAVQCAFTLKDPETRNREIRALVEVAKIHNLKDLSIVTWNEEETIKADGKTIAVIPVYRFSGVRDLRGGE
jgi:predicted AAA+ superfamily ATPase